MKVVHVYKAFTEANEEGVARSIAALAEGMRRSLRRFDALIATATLTRHHQDVQYAIEARRSAGRVTTIYDCVLGVPVDASDASLHSDEAA